MFIRYVVKRILESACFKVLPHLTGHLSRLQKALPELVPPLAGPLMVLTGPDVFAKDTLELGELPLQARNEFVDSPLYAEFLRRRRSHQLQIIRGDRDPALPVADRHMRLKALTDGLGPMPTSEQASVDFGLLWLNPVIPAAEKLQYIAKSEDPNLRWSYLAQWDPTSDWKVFQGLGIKGGVRVLEVGEIITAMKLVASVPEPAAVLEHVHPSVKAVSVVAGCKPQSQTVGLCGERGGS